MAFNNWPYTNFQDLNLGWIISTYKTALYKALEALGKANAVEAEVGTYTDQINAATLTANQASATANQAMTIASNANEVLFISADAENKAVNYVTWSQGGSGYVTAADIYSAIVTDHKVPVFMDRSQYIYEMAGYETDPNSPLTITRFKFTKNGGNREDIVWIDGSGSITYTTSYSGGGTLVVNITRSSGSGTTTSDTTYAAIESAYENGMTVQCHVVDELNGLEYYAYDCFFTENNDTGDYFGWYSPFDYTSSRFYRAFVREDGLAGISNIPVSGGGGSGAFVIPVTSTTSGGVTTYSTTATFAEIMANKPNLIVYYTNAGLYYTLSYSGTSDPNSWYRFIFTAQEPHPGELDTEWLYVICENNSVTITAYSLDIIGLPAVSSADNGKFLRVVNGSWAADTVPSAETTSFGP